MFIYLPDLFMKLIKIILLGLTFGLLANAQAQTVNPMPRVNNDWRFSGTASAWVPASWTTTSVGNLSGTADTSISDNLNSAGAVGMFTLEAHKGNWGVMGDIVYWQLAGGGSATFDKKKGIVPDRNKTLYVGGNAQQTQTMLTMAGTYTAYNTPGLYLDGLLGARYISSTTTIQATGQYSVNGITKLDTSINPSYTNQTTDPVIGFKGRARIADTSWFIPFYADAGKGPGSNNTTWQTLIGVGDAFSWGDITLAYRAMGFDLKSSYSVTKYTNAGPQLSATINF
jgi:hypothetical protein